MKLGYIIIISLLFSNNKINGQSYPGTNLRGQVIIYNYQQQIPLVSAKVDLFFYDSSRFPGQQWVLIANTITDAYGFYFFKGITPNFYTIWINQSKSYNIQVLMIDYRYYTYQDLPQFAF